MNDHLFASAAPTGPKWQCPIAVDRFTERFWSHSKDSGIGHIGICHIYSHILGFMANIPNFCVLLWMLGWLLVEMDCMDGFDWSRMVRLAQFDHDEETLLARHGGRLRLGRFRPRGETVETTRANVRIETFAALSASLDTASRSCPRLTRLKASFLVPNPIIICTAN